MAIRGWSEHQLAWAIGYSLHALGGVLDDEEPISPSLALRLEEALGPAAESWLQPQRDLDLNRLRDRMGGDLARVRRRSGLPVPDLP
jgi:addiction module HigA family antidote